MTVETAPKVLVLGALGFVGRNFVQYLVENNLASSIRAVDKALPQTAYLTKPARTAFSHSTVEFMQANLINPGLYSHTQVTHIRNASTDTQVL
jgi:nucleoside-diphosphate-sugar epimerase